MRQRKAILIIGCLCLLDQSIKLFIQFFCFDVHVSILYEILGFYPIINTLQSWGGNFLPVLSNPYIAIAFNVLLLLLIHSMYTYYRKQENISSLYRLTYVLFMAGGICSFIDKVGWGGSLDYVALFDWFIFDLKDCYLSLAIVLLLAGSFLQPISFDTKDYVRYVQNKCYKKKSK